MIDFVIPISRDESVLMLGEGEKNLLLIEKYLDIKATSRGGILRITAPNTIQKKKIISLFENLKKISLKGFVLTEENIIEEIKIIDTNKVSNPNKKDSESSQELQGNITDPVIINGHRKSIRPQTKGQIAFYNSLKENDITFAIGPAGTGKTFVAVAFALQALISGEVDKIIVTRPAIEAGETLGFLPGDLKEKINPYLRPIYDSLYTIMPHKVINDYMQEGVIEIAPIAFMRGRTLNNAFVILDEAQNSTAGQMKMFLTRLGTNSKAVITGDATQIDLQHNITSGLVEIQKVLKKVSGISFCYFDSGDVVRHSLVQKIINAYDKYEKKS